MDNGRVDIESEATKRKGMVSSICGSSDNGRIEIIDVVNAEDEGCPAWREQGFESTRPDGALVDTPCEPLVPRRQQQRPVCVGANIFFRVPGIPVLLRRNDPDPR